MNKQKVIVIVGATASGKSEVANIVAKHYLSPVISADSMQIYTGLDIGTAKENEKTTGVQQLMTNIIDIYSNYSVADYVRDATKEIEKVLMMGKVPIICGGTGLYVTALVNNMSFEEMSLQNGEQVEYVKQIEKEIHDMSTEEKIAFLGDKLSESDQKNITRINSKVFKKLLQKKLGNEKNVEKSKLWERNAEKYDFLIINLETPRLLLYHKIEERVDRMIANGLLDEAKYLFDRRDKASRTSLQAIGYKEFFEYFTNQATLDECINKLKADTKHYAKRQITWFKKLNNKIVLDATRDKLDIAKEIIERYDGKR